LNRRWSASFKIGGWNLLAANLDLNLLADFRVPR